MEVMLEYIKSWWKRLWSVEAKDKYPPRDEHQKNYRKEFGDIVDQYLIYYDSDGKDFREIVYIDAENDIDWFIEGDSASKEDKQIRHRYIAKLDTAHAASVQNLSKKEIINFKKILGVGYSAALHCNWEEVGTAISKAMEYRDARNKERSRLMLLSAATLYLFVLVGAFLLFYHFASTHPHMNMFWGILMGTVGAYVSIWTRYGKMDMTGLGTPSIHYLEAFARMLIGAIFATVIFFAFKSGVVLRDVMTSSSERLIFGLIGFCAGFSENLVPSVMEHFVTNSTKNEK